MSIFDKPSDPPRPSSLIEEQLRELKQFIDDYEGEDSDDFAVQVTLKSLLAHQAELRKEWTAALESEWGKEQTERLFQKLAELGIDDDGHQGARVELIIDPKVGHS